MKTTTLAKLVKNLIIDKEVNKDVFIKQALDEIYLLGDARQVSNIMYGIWDAFEVANHI